MSHRASASLTSTDEGDILGDLAAALGRRPGSEDRQAWLGMTPAQRDKALRRIALLNRWTGDRGDLTLEDASAQAGVRPKRFYEMASAWRKGRGLASLGSYAKATPRRSRLDARAINLLQAVVPRVLDRETGLSVEALRSRVLDDVAVQVAKAPFEPPLRMPSRMVVRRMIERELARRAAEGLVAHDIAFDCSLAILPDSMTQPFLFSAVVDRATGLLLGVWAGVPSDTLTAYAGAASDVLVRSGRLIGAGEWADATERIEIAAGVDGRGRIVASAIACLSGAPSVRTALSCGRYLRAAVGDRLGRLEFRAIRDFPGRREASDGVGDLGAATRLEVANAVEAHNAAIAVGDHLPELPDNVVPVMELVSRLDSRAR